jgi:hypothetical protein
MKKLLLVSTLVAFLAGAAGYVFGQAISSRTLTGNEAWQVAIGGPGGSSIFTTIAQARNAQGVTTTATTSGTLVMTTNTATLISTAAAGGAMVVDLPPTPFDGEIFEWVNGSAGAFTTGNTVATTDGSTIQGSNATLALAAASSIEFRYSIGTNTWYKLR